MNDIVLTTVDGLEPRDAVGIVWRLTKPESEWQLEVLSCLRGEGSSSTPVAVWRKDGCLIGWACSHVWRDQQTLEMFVDERHRREGKAFTLASMLASSGVIDRTKPVAVFSEPTAAIARRLGLTPVVYERRGGDWVAV
jgi:hypothetical protein